MNRIRCRINECSDGDIVASDVYTEAGLFIVPSKTTLNEYIKAKLYDLNIQYIDVFKRIESKSTVDQLNEKRESLRLDYCTKLELMKTIFQDIAAGKKLKMELINCITESIYSEVYSNYHLVECVNSIKNADEYTHTHCLNVSIYAMFIAKYLKFGNNEIKDIIISGLLHDIGKTKIPLEILNKKGSLDKGEFEVIKKHSVLGYDIINSINELKNEIKIAVLMHHERENGSGYPMGLHSNDIGSYAKIIAIADIYDALTSKRVYRTQLTPFDTFKEMENIAMSANLYDLKILFAFLAGISTYYIGVKVKLNDGRSGEIVYIPPQDISNPIVKVGNQYINIAAEHEIGIAEVL